MNERDYLRLRRRIEDECKEKLDALELVWQMVNKHGDSGTDSTDGIKRGDLQNAILRAIGTFNHDFSAEQVLARIRDTEPDIGQRAKASSVSSALKRMEGQELEVVIRGVGRKPSLYRMRKPDLKAVGT